MSGNAAKRQESHIRTLRRTLAFYVRSEGDLNGAYVALDALEAEIARGAETGDAREQAFKDCLRLRELADRQTLTVKDGRDLAAIADRLHALAVSSIETRYEAS